MKLVIVGGVAGGASAATRARRLAEDAEIVLFERGPDVSFANCGLPYHIGGTIAERSKLLVVTPERLRARFRLDVRTRSEVLSIDRAARRVRVRDLERGREYDESYDTLLLAPGAAPIRPPLPGIEHPAIHTLRNLQDMDRIIAAVAEGARGVIIGAGFIGLELAENLVARRVVTTIVELQDQVLPPLDKELTTPLLASLVERGVEVLLSEAATGFEPAPAGQGVVVRLRSGRSLNADFVVLGVGVRPENQLAVAAGLETGPRGGIQVDSSLRTSDPAIYAVGDVIETQCSITSEPSQVPLAGPANRQGRIAATNICARGRGGSSNQSPGLRYRGTQGTAILGLFGKTAAMTGLSEKSLRRSGRPFRAVYIHPGSHAGYYPGAEQMTLKLLFDPESGKVLGAQGIGGRGVDKRIDVLAVAIQAGLTVFDLEEVELAYAPQYGSAKDPINMLGFVGAGIVRGEHPQLDWPTVLADPTARVLLDVRTPSEFAAGSVPGALNVPVDDLRERLAELPRDRELAVFCQVGQRGYLATRILLQRGYRAANISGGYLTYRLIGGW